MDGHYEVDTVEAYKSDQYYLLTFIDMYRQKLYIRKVLKNSYAVAEGVLDIINEIISEGKKILTITMDNGTENYQIYKVTEPLKIILYRTRPGSGGNKGGLECSHRMIRNIYPKGTCSFDPMTENDLSKLQFYVRDMFEIK